jgi:aminopeptidase N
VIGDAAAIGPLRRMIDRELDGRLRRRGKEVVRDLENGTSVGEDVRRLRDEISELRSLAVGLRERLELLEARTGDSDEPAPKPTLTPRARRKPASAPPAKPAKAKPAKSIKKARR